MKLRSTVAMACALILVALVFEPVSATNLPLAEVPSLADAGLGHSESAAIPTSSADSVGGPSPPAGSAISASVPPIPITSALPRMAMSPRLEESPTEYRYWTVSGLYVFAKAAPYLLRYEPDEGEVFVRDSTFVAVGPRVSLFQNAEVLTATAYRYEVRYDLTNGVARIGNVTLSYNFRDDGPPKITASLRQSSGLPLPLTWVSFPTDSFVFNGMDSFDITARKQASAIDAPELRLVVGPNNQPAIWPRRVQFNWSDAGAGNAFVGPFSVGSLSGQAVVVTFPAEMTTVDPSVVGSSTSSAATDYSIQRKTFAFGDRFWVFWYDGTNIVYSSARDAVTWNAPISTGSGSVPRGFDVDQRDGTVLLGYVASDLKSMKVLKGAIAGSFVTWDAPVTVASWTTAEAGVPSVVIGTDGYFWVSFIWTTGVSWVDTYRSTDRWSTSFSLSVYDGLSGVPADSAARLVALSNGGIVRVTSTVGSTTIVTRRYWAGGWLSPNTWDLKLPTADARGGVLAAISDLQDNVYMIFKGDNTNAPGLRYAILRSNDALDPSPGNPPYTIDSTSNPNQPVVARDANGDLHVFWLYVTAPPFLWRIRYSRQRPFGGSWSTYTEPFSSTGAQRTGLTAGPFGTSQMFLAWTYGDFSPFSIYFGSVPSPMNLGSQTGQPWNRQGISPYQSYFRQLSEYVSPGSGLLTVKQTDLVLPGRNLNLEISRVYTTPRAFSGGIAPSPYLYEENLDYNIGKAWQLNFPWLSDQYVHLWDGQLYAIHWNGDQFENHDGEHFVLYRVCLRSCKFFLETKSGLQYFFDAQHRLAQILDPTQNNIISFTYGYYGISEIADTIGRKVTFAYNTDGTIQSASSGTQKVTYSYQTVSGMQFLRSVRDPANRETLFEHTDSRDPYLLTSVKYPTGAKTAFTWSNPAVQIGSDLLAYYVTRQDTLNSAGQSIRANTYDYTTVNGLVSYVKVTSYDAGVVKSSTLQQYDSAARRSTTIRRDAAANQLSKEVSWFDAAGAVGQVDVYPGTSASPAYSLYSAYDEWGNLIYSRDAVGHEKFASYVNTRFQGGFYAPGRLTRASSGLLFADDFEDRDISDWTLDTSAGTVSLDYSAFDSLPPSVKVAHNGAPSGVASMTHTFTAQSGYFVAEATVRAQETNKNHYVLLRTSTAAIRVYVALNYLGYIAWTTGSTWNNIMPYQAGEWYRIGFRVSTSANTYDIWVNGQLVKAGATLAGSGNIDRINLQASCSGCGAATMYVDMVKTYQNDGVTIQGLQAGQMARLEDAWGRLVDWRRVASGGTSTVLVAGPGVFPVVTIKIFNSEGFLIYATPAHEFWGGDVWTFTPPWKAFPGRTQSGFLRSWVDYVDDALPSGAVPTGAEDGWNWLSSDPNSFGFPASGSFAHISKNLVGIHQHYFGDASYMVLINSGMYHIQYVFVPESEYPSEIMLQFRDTSNSWEHRAYWGANLVPWGTDGTNSRRSMGTLPGSPGRWLMLIVKADDVGMNGLTLEGLAYTLYGGRAAWDYSAVGYWDTGWLQISGLQQYWKGELYDPQGTLISSGTVPAGGTVAPIPLYDAASKVRAFPFDGYFLVRDSANNPIYRSPVMSFWGGDIYNYGGTDFYPNANVDSNIHDRVAATLDYQTGRTGQPLVPIDSYFRFTSQGLPDRKKVRDGSVFRETSFTYDGLYGQITAVTDPLSNSVSFSYSSTYGNAYVTQARDDLGGIVRYTYDPTTGWLLSQSNPRGYRTRYEYDALGRKTATYHFDLPAASEVLYWDMERTTEEATPRMDDLAGKGNAGTITGTSDAAGPVGRARVFDGSTSYITAGDIADFPGTASFTVSAWFRRTADSTNWVRLVSKEKLTVPREGWLLFIHAVGFGADNKIGFERWTSGVSTSVASQTVTALNTWYHVTTTYDGSTLRMYVNGVQESSAASTNSLNGNAYPLRVGAISETGGVVFNGLIDEVRIFDRALSATEVPTLYDNSYRLLSSSRTAYDDFANVVTTYDPTTRRRNLHFDMETLLNSYMEDISGYGNEGTIVGPTSVAGKVGRARDFSGTDQYIDVADNPSLDVQSVTIAAWVYPRSVNDAGTILWKGDSQTGYALTFTSASKLRLSVGDAGTARTLDSAASIQKNKWTHVAGTYDGHTLTLYINGAVDTSMTYSTLLPIGDSPLGLRIGAQPNTNPPAYDYNGIIDEVQVVGRPLTGSEISSIYQGTESGSYQKQYYDSLGRATRAVRRDLFSAMTSTGSYTYDFQDRVLTATVARDSTTSFTTTYQYDSLGRPTKVTYPGTSQSLTISYDDVSRIRAVVAENGRKTQYLFDLAGRLITVREYYDASNYYTTSYAYDEVGDLLTVTNALSQVTRHSYDNLNRLAKTTYPDGKYEAYTYDVVGNLKTRQDRALQVTTYTYDDLYRLKTIDRPGTSGDVSYEYDADSNPVTVTNPTATITLAYDGLDRLITETDTIGSAYQVDYSFDAAGRLTQLTYPQESGGSRLAVSYLYDAVGRLSLVKGPTTTYATFTYFADDLTKDVTFGDGIVQAYQYNGRGWPTSIKATYTSGGKTTTYLDLPYSYDNSGNVLSMGSASFTYDALDRLKTASGAFGSQTYTYDAIGNRKSLVVGSTTTTYAYDDGVTGTDELLSSIRSGVTTSYGYDNNMDLTSKTGGWAYEWGPDGLMSRALQNSAQLQKYYYDGLGRRVKVEGSSASTWIISILSGQEVIFEKDQGGSVTKYIFGGGMRVAEIAPSGTFAYYLGDHLGSTRQVRDSTRGLQFSADYEPFGKPISVTGSEVFRFTGEKHDGPTGFIYLRARQYDPDLGRFVSADPILGSLLNPQSLNRFVYVINNPLRFVDPTGEACSPAPWDWGSCLGDAASAVGQWWDNLDPNWKTAIIFAALTVAVIATAGLAAPLAGIAASGIITTMISGALVAGTVSGLMYVGTSLATGQQVTLSGFFANFAIGAFMGAVGSVAGMAGGSLAKAAHLAANSPFAKLFTGIIIAGSSVLTDVLQGERDPMTIVGHAGLSLLGAKFGDKYFPTKGMTTFKQAQYFSPRTLKAFLRVVLSPATAGRNAKSLIYGTAFESEVAALGEAGMAWYKQTFG